MLASNSFCPNHCRVGVCVFKKSRWVLPNRHRVVFFLQWKYDIRETKPNQTKKNTPKILNEHTLNLKAAGFVAPER